ncbi:kunitz trypsin inhibitor 5 [Beta vulgaris subsp. vulgaris]|uniref:kunitz trypsin inhibitor 5 n=1 Tax=Beta vulgaris subsp. vulgaris TaxID=3555 RepID=UPI002036EB90|nr:kunitz trypsin inhibitor 5 [Beta vulgaris subsp. vulgaris]
MATHFISSTLVLATFLLFVSPPAAVAQVINIFDMDAEPVKAGKLYYILPVVQRQGGGISTVPKNANESSCPLYVVQEKDTTSLGLAVTFNLALPNTTNVTFSADMNIVFGQAINCVESPVWTLALDEPTGRRYVALGGLGMARGPKAVNNWFRIERFFPRFHFDYKFVFCPTRVICPTCQNSCGDLGVFVRDDGTWVLGVGAPPLRIKFKKA